MLKQSVQEKLNQQLNAEFYASFLYLSMSAYCQSEALTGFANWYGLQSQEEYSHAMKIYRYLIDQDAPVILHPIEAPPATFSSIADVVSKTLENEQKVTTMITDLAGFCLDEKDHATHIFLHWFVTEQIEEEAAVRDLRDRLKLIGNSGEGLLMLDRDLGARAPEKEAE